MLKEFDNFISTTENSNAKIEESVKTLLFVVKKESDILFRKKEQNQVAMWLSAAAIWLSRNCYTDFGCSKVNWNINQT